MGAPEKLDPDTKKYYAQFYNILPHLLPCGVCGDHLMENLKTLPVEPHLDGREALFKWTVTMHNIVNKHTGKREYSLDEAFEHWKRVCLGDDKECRRAKSRSIKIWVYMIVSIVLIFAFLYFFMFSGSKSTVAGKRSSFH